MSRSPSLLALLGLAAVAGYQNRDALSAMMRKIGVSQPWDATPGPAAAGATPAGTEFPSIESMGRGLVAGLNDLVGRFTAAGSSERETLRSWVGPGQNQPISEASLRQVLGGETLADLSERTGLTQEELLSRLAQVLPETVDKMTPAGVLPTEDDLQSVSAAPGGQRI